MIRVRQEVISFFFFAFTLSLHIFIFTQRMQKKKKKLQIGSLRNKMYFKSIFKECFFGVKRFQPIIRVANNGQEKFTILCVPHVGFLCYLDSDKILL